MNLAAITPTQTFPLAGGDAGVSYTIQKMRRLIDQGVKSAPVRAQALEILNGNRVRGFDWMGQARAIYGWVLRNVTFTPDPRGKEGLQAAEWTLEYRRGDCDDYTILLCSLLGTIGMKCRIVTIAGQPDDPTQFSHVYPEVSVDGRWVTVDAARRNPEFGKAPARFYRRRAWSVDSGEWSEMTGLAAFNPGRLPGAYRANVSPVWKRVRAARRYGRSSGNYRTLGAVGVDWSAITGAITAGGKTAAEIISASRAAPSNIYPPSGYLPGTPYGYGSGSYLQQPQSFFGSMSTGTLLIGGVGLLALFAIARAR